jgi:hypothetical protein
VSEAFKYVAAVALLPAALNPSLIASASGIALSLCGSAAGATVTVPAGAPSLPGTNGAACCAKGCHASQERKRGKLYRMA